MTIRDHITEELGCYLLPMLKWVTLLHKYKLCKICPALLCFSFLLFLVQILQPAVVSCLGNLNGNKEPFSCCFMWYSVRTSFLMRIKIFSNKISNTKLFIICGCQHCNYCTLSSLLKVY